jgi:hypothetical protein
MPNSSEKNVSTGGGNAPVVRCFGSEVFYKLIADYIGNTQPIGYVFKSSIGEYYDRFPANFARVSEQDWKDYKSSIEK